ncbi:MAG TPA: hypothetical protein VF883_07830 [Thermoanaerobaculia bacterium]
MTTTVSLLRIRAAADDPLAVQMRGQAALRPLDLRPAAMPAHAILCVRRMSDPLPGAIDLRTSHASRPTEWERAARVAVSRAFSAAVRPLRAPAVPAEAEAVLFDDRAELLACAARDVARGEPASWYWAQTFPSLTIDAVVRELAREPRYLPIVIELLARSGDAVAFARLLSTEHVATLCGSVELKAAAAIVAPLAHIESAPSFTRPALARAVTLLAASHAPELATSAAASTLTIEQHLFLIALLTLHRAPETADSQRFSMECGGLAAAFQVAALSSPHSIKPTAEQPRNEAEPAQSRRAAPNDVAHASHATSPLTSNEQRRVPQRDLLEPEGERVPAPRRAKARRSTPSHTPTLLTATHATGHAGVFFLLNVAIALGYYRDPRERRLDLHPWDFVALAGRALFPKLDDEPLFELLDELAPPHRRRRRISRPLVARMRRLLAAVELPPRMLIRRYGRIAVTPAHVEVSFSLETHPIEIRMAGLDRDPGWIPEAGRHVAFHFD